MDKRIRSFLRKVMARSAHDVMLARPHKSRGIALAVRAGDYSVRISIQGDGRHADRRLFSQSPLDALVHLVPGRMRQPMTIRVDHDIDVVLAGKSRCACKRSARDVIPRAPESEHSGFSFLANWSERWNRPDDNDEMRAHGARWYPDSTRALFRSRSSANRKASVQPASIIGVPD